MSKQKVVLISKRKEKLEKIREDLYEDFGIVASIKEKAGNHLLFVNTLFEYQIAVVYIRLKNYGLSYADDFVDMSGKKGYIARSQVFFFGRYFIPKQYVNSKEAKELLEYLRNIISTETGCCVHFADTPINSELCNLYGLFPQIFEVFKKTLDEKASLQEAIVSFIIKEVPRISNSVREAVAIFEESDAYKGKKEFFGVSKCLDFWGSEIDTKSQEKRERLLDLYLEYVSKRGTIEVGSAYPEGLNLSPKEDENKHFNENDEYWRSESGYNKEYIAYEDGEIMECEKGLVKKSAWVTNYHESATPNSKPRTVFDKKFAMRDTVAATHRVEICDNSMLKVISFVEVERVVQGEKLCTLPTVYDALYQNKKYENGKFNFTVTDYYEIISLNKLLHYTDASKFYEVIEIPVDFSFEDGLKGLESKVYDDGDKDWICYQDISEVKDALLEEKADLLKEI